MVGEKVPDPWRHQSLDSALAAPEPRSLSEQTIKRGAATDEVIHTYLRGRFHTEVLIRGAQCSSCDHRMETMTTRGPLGTKRQQHFPFKATLKQVRRGASCGNCEDGRLDFDLQLLSINKGNQYNEPGEVMRFRPDKEGADDTQ